MSRAKISRSHANAVAKMKAEDLMQEGIEELEAGGIFPDVADGIIMTEDEVLESQWPFDDDEFIQRDGWVKDKFGIGGLVYDTKNPESCPVDLGNDDFETNEGFFMF